MNINISINLNINININVHNSNEAEQGVIVSNHKALWQRVNQLIKWVNRAFWQCTGFFKK